MIRHGDGYGRRAIRYGFALAAALAVLALALALPASAENGGYRLKIKSAVAVSGEAITLGDLAEPYGDIGSGEWRRLSATQLWRSPERGRPVSIDADRLKGAMASVLPELVPSCIFPSQTVIQRGGRVVEEPELRRIAVGILTPAAMTLGGETEFRDWRLPPYILLPDEMDTVKTVLSEKIAAGRVMFRFEARSVDGRVTRDVSASVFMDVWKAVPTAARPLNRGELLTPDLVSFQKKNLAYAGAGVWDGKSGPYRISRSIGQGQVIGMDAVESPPAVTKGGKVDLTFRGKNIRLSVPAEAMQDGQAGQTIPVRNLQSQKIIQAVIQDQTTVLVR